MNDPRKALLDIFRNVFAELSGAPEEKVKGATRDSLEGWDSANHLLLVTCLEQDFQVRIADKDIVSLDSFRKVLAFVEAHAS